MKNTKSEPVHVTLFVRTGDKRWMPVAHELIGSAVLYGLSRLNNFKCERKAREQGMRGNHCTNTVCLGLPTRTAYNDYMARLYKLKGQFEERDDRFKKMKLVVFAQEGQQRTFIRSCVL